MARDAPHAHTCPIQVCENCNGEGCFVRGEGKKASMELKEKMRKVEALIAEASDLEELERLEAALQKKSIKDLDAILKEYRMKQLDALDAAAAQGAEALSAATADQATSSED